MQLDIDDTPVYSLEDSRAKIFEVFPKLEILNNTDKDGQEINYSDEEFGDEEFGEDEFDDGDEEGEIDQKEGDDEFEDADEEEDGGEHDEYEADSDDKNEDVGGGKKLK